MGHGGSGRVSVYIPSEPIGSLLASLVAVYRPWVRMYGCTDSPPPRVPPDTPRLGCDMISHYFQAKNMLPLMPLNHGNNIGSRGADGLQNKPGLSDFESIMFFRKVRPESEGRRHAHLGIKLPPVQYTALSGTELVAGGVGSVCDRMGQEV